MSVNVRTMSFIQTLTSQKFSLSINVTYILLKNYIIPMYDIDIVHTLFNFFFSLLAYVAKYV